MISGQNGVSAAPPDADEGRTGRCLALCRQCGVPVPHCGLHALAMPFGDSDARDLWAAEHIRFTGHEVGKVEGWPDADATYRMLFGWPEPIETEQEPW